MLKKMEVGSLQANCYIIGHAETREGCVIDPGGEVFRIVQEISNSNLTISHIILTHGHFDHASGAAELRGILKAPVCIHQSDAGALGFQADEFLIDGQVLMIGAYKLTVLHTPGHTPGGICILAPGAVFTGDTLFAGSIGRSDFVGGDYRQLIKSIQEKLFPLGNDLRVYPGHGPASSIGRERTTNPFFVR
ncbi:MAG TPA: MBL fold metallo-hydrolase [Thermodesulfobacteriota bacterium]|nr:MBL fold metallo-hydrolase [Thermodesulfobacteriota bacterium]